MHATHTHARTHTHTEGEATPGRSSASQVKAAAVIKARRRAICTVCARVCEGVNVHGVHDRTRSRVCCTEAKNHAPTKRYGHQLMVVLARCIHPNARRTPTGNGLLISNLEVLGLWLIYRQLYMAVHVCVCWHHR